MKAGGSNYGPLWDSLLTDLASFAPTPGAVALCLNLRPLREGGLVRQAQAQTREMQNLLAQHNLFTELKLPTEKHWFKKSLQHNPSKQRLVGDFIKNLHDLRHILQLHQGRFPTLWNLGREIQSDEVLYKALQSPQNISQLLADRLHKRQGWLERQLEIFDRFGMIAARAKYADKQGGNWAHISSKQDFKLLQWSPYRLNTMPPIDLELNTELRVLVLTGAHQTGKTRLLQSIYLDLLRHQTGLSLQCSSDSILPVFSGLNYLTAQQPLVERLQDLKPFLNQDAQRLLLIDGFLAQGSAGETYALGRAVLEHLSKHHGLTVVSSHDHLLTRQIPAADKSLRVMGLERENKRKQSRLKLIWAQHQPSNLKSQAQAAGWPSVLLRQADGYLKELTKDHVPQKKAQPERVKPKQKKQVKVSPLKPIQRDVSPGTTVYIPSLNQYGELRLPPNNRNEVEVFCQDKIIRLRADQVVISSHRKEKKGDTSGITIQTWSLSSDECDLHGLTVDEALPVFEKFLDTAFHQGLARVRVVHGKGTSTLRHAVHQHLNQLLQHNAYIRSFRLGYHGEGDSGVTVVELK